MIIRFTNIRAISDEIFQFTGGYPFLVSRICQCIDKKLDKTWTLNGVQNAIKIILEEKNTLFDDLYKNLENNRNLYNLIYDILMAGKSRTYSAGNPTIDLGMMFGIIKKSGASISISNKIFEIIICDYFISKNEDRRSGQITNVFQYDVIKDGRFDMELCLRKFAEYYSEVYSGRDVKFLERDGKFLFLMYIRPLLNGFGFYHFESELSDMSRMDIVVDFDREQFIIELKIWRGEKHHQEAFKQLTGYLERKHKNSGYLLTFDLRKEVNRECKAEWIEYDGKKIFDVIV